MGWWSTDGQPVGSSLFQEKPTVEEALSTDINTGIYIFEPEIFDHIPSGVSFDIGGDLLPKLVAENAPFYGIRMDFEWVDIGKVPDYWRAIQDVLTGGCGSGGYSGAGNSAWGLRWHECQGQLGQD